MLQFLIAKFAIVKCQCNNLQTSVKCQIGKKSHSSVSKGGYQGPSMRFASHL